MTTVKRNQTGLLNLTALLGCGVIAGPLFIIVFLIEGATRPAYSPMRNSVSSLALGPFGWIQTVNFLVAGVLTLAFAVGARRALRPGKGSTWGPVFIGLWALGVIVAGIFVTDPESGYPPGSPVPYPDLTTHGLLHNLSVVLGFPAFAVACIVFVRRFLKTGERGWALCTAITGVAFVASAELAFRGFGHVDGLGATAGLFERTAGGIAFVWISAFAIHLLGRVAGVTSLGRRAG